MLRRFLLALIVALGLSPLFVTGQAAAAQSSCAQWLHAADISNYNGSPNWQDVSTSGLAGLYILAADGTWTDPSFVPDVWGAQSIGLAWGGYYFARTNVDPVAAADLAIQAGFAKGVLPPVLDLELSGLSPDQTASWANTFGDVVLFITHRTMTLYTGAFYTWSQEPSLGQWPLWLSDYVYGYTPVTSSCGLPVPAAPSQWGDWSGWQFTSSGNAPGLGSPLDLSVFEADWFEEYTGLRRGSLPAAHLEGRLLWPEGRPDRAAAHNPGVVPRTPGWGLRPRRGLRGGPLAGQARTRCRLRVGAAHRRCDHRALRFAGGQHAGDQDDGSPDRPAPCGAVRSERRDPPS